MVNERGARVLLSSLLVGVAAHKPCFVAALPRRKSRLVEDEPMRMEWLGRAFSHRRDEPNIVKYQIDLGAGGEPGSTPMLSGFLHVDEYSGP